MSFDTQKYGRFAYLKHYNGRAKRTRYNLYPQNYKTERKEFLLLLLSFGISLITLNHDDEESYRHWCVTLAIKVTFFCVSLAREFWIFGCFTQNEIHTHTTFKSAREKVEIFSISFPICSQFTAKKIEKTIRSDHTESDTMNTLLFYTMATNRLATLKKSKFVVLMFVFMKFVILSLG